MAMTIPRIEERKGFNIRWRYVFAVAILVPVLAHLFFAITRSPLTNYYVTVDELAAQGNGALSGRVRVGAPIMPGTINWDNTSRTLTFQLQGEAKNLTVTYRGFAPDTFRDSATAIVEGELNRDGTFTAYNLLIKCPHQYVPAL
jgi:cytochrome c-type biogenesis protein CcmE